MFKRMTAMITLVLIVLSFAALAGARLQEADYSTYVPQHGSRSPIILFFDDMEGGTNGWTSTDNTTSATPKFHLDGYYAYQGSYSYWCGEMNAGFAGGDGYANGWDQLLVVPAVDVTGATYPVMTFAYRYDSEAGYDFTYVQAESLGAYVNLNAGYDGSSVGWQDYGDYGFIMSGYDNPIQARFRFIADGAYSDSDGLYDSDGGAFHVDNIKIFDFYGGSVYFYDDAEGGALCTPTVPASAGDYWHQITRACPAYSDPTSWWCGDDADTTLVPPGLSNSLLSPQVNIAGSSVCTLRLLLHAEVPTVDNDYWTEEVTTDGGTTWYLAGAYWGGAGIPDEWLVGLAGKEIIEPILAGLLG